MSHQKRVLPMSLVCHLSFVLFTGIFFISVQAQAVEDLISENTPVGMVDGHFSVAANGSPSWSVEVETPQAANGLAPRVKFGYDGSSRNGLLGVGGFLDGISKITRCGQSKPIDGRNRGITVSNKDRFCLDGQRLIAINGEYGANGTVYHTEIDNLIRVTTSGRVTNPDNSTSPMRFIVHRPDGSTTTLGGHPTSRVSLFKNGQEWVFEWRINRFLDTYGNTIEYEYKDFPGKGIAGQWTREVLPVAIHYGAHTSGQNHTMSVRFGYQFQNREAVRADSTFAYVGGLALRSRRLLASISTFIGNAKVKEYKINYNSGLKSQRSRMDSVTECANDGACLVPTKFTWRNGYRGWNKSPMNPPDDLFTMGDGTPRGITVDLNGDGLQDWVTAFRNRNGGQPRTAWINTGSGWDQQSQWNPPSVVFDAEHDNAMVSEVADVNGDGLLDWVVGHNTNFGRRLETYINTGSGWQRDNRFVLPIEIFSTSVSAKGESLARLLDLNADGLADVVVATRRSNGRAVLGAWLNTGNAWVKNDAYQPLFLHVDYQTNNEGEQQGQYIDLNGDGLPDFLASIRSRNGQADGRAFLNTGNGWRRANQYDAPTHLFDYRQNARGNTQGDLVDINGDGLVDFVVSGQSFGRVISRVWINTGRSWLSAPSFNPPEPIYELSDKGTLQRGLFLDVTADGLLDYVVSYFDGSRLVSKMWRNTGRTWEVASNKFRLPEAVHVARGRLDSRQRAITTDINGDGSTDLVFAEQGGSRRIYIQAPSGNRNASHETVTAITNSFGVTTKFRYVLTSDSGVYTKGPRASGATRDLDHPTWVVSGVDTDDGIGGTLTVNHRYGDARLDKIRGVATMGWHEVKDPRNAVSVRTYYEGAWPLAGRIKQAVKKVGNQQVKLTLNTHKALPTNGGKTQRIALVYSQEKTWDLNGTAINTVTRSAWGHDAFANPTGQNELITSVGSSYKTTITRTLDNNTRAWLIGLPAVTTTHLEKPGHTTVTTVQRRTHNAQGSVQRSIANPGNPNQVVTTFAYDKFGNSVSTRVVPLDMRERINRAWYTQDGRFQTTSIDALGQVTKREFDWRFGLVTKETGPNGSRKESRYDAFGNLIRERTVNDNTNFPDWDKVPTTDIVISKWCTPTSQPLCPKLARYFVTTLANDNEAMEAAYYDNQGREIRRVTQGFQRNSADSTDDNDFKAVPIYVDTFYDAFGRKRRVSNPYFKGEEPTFTHRVYDALDRVVVETAPNGARTTYWYNGPNRGTTNALGQKSSTVLDAKGHVVQAVDARGGSIKHHYDAAERLVKTIDASNGITTNTYDNAGNKITSNSPDLGLWRYTYNALGQRTNRTDAEGQNTRTRYDILGRMISEETAHGTSTFEYYNTQNAAGNGAWIGKLFRETSAEGVSHTYVYTRWGRIRSKITRIDGHNFKTSYDYQGASERISSVTYPSGLAARYLYNALGFLESVRTGGESQWTAYETKHRQARLALKAAKDFHEDKKDQIAQLNSLSQQWAERANELIPQIEALQATLDRLAQKHGADGIESQIEAIKRQYADVWPRFERILELYENIFDDIEELEAKLEQHNRSKPSYSEEHGTDEEREAYEKWESERDDLKSRIDATYNKLPADTRDFLENNSRLAEAQIKISNLLSRLDPYRQEAKPYLDEISRLDTQFNGFAAKSDSYASQAQGVINQITAKYRAVESQAQEAERLLQTYRSNSNLVWKLLATNAQGQVKRSRLGNNIITRAAFDTQGRVRQIDAKLGNREVVKQNFAYDKLGNLTWRKDQIQNIEESFVYDQLNRLKTARLAGAVPPIYRQLGLATVNVNYDATGNITYKSDVGSYTYGNNAGPHAVTAIRGQINADFQYDKNGNQLAGNGRRISYNAIHKPNRIVTSASAGQLEHRSVFTYGPSGEVIKKTDRLSNGRTVLTYTLGDYDWVVSSQEGREHRHHIRAGNDVIAVVERRNGQSERTQYLHRDHLNSVIAITDQNAGVLERYHYDAFGKQRAGLHSNRGPMRRIEMAYTERGYTGHLMLQGSGLIHMGGRVYDPKIARFIQADPFVQYPNFTQSLNRYSYVLNNPLSFNDPSGYFLGFLIYKKIKENYKRIFYFLQKKNRQYRRFVKNYYRQIISVAMLVFAPQISGYLGMPTAAGTFVIGGVTGMLSTGSFSLETFLVSGVFATLTFGIGDSITNYWYRTAMHSLVGGIRTKHAGGSFTKAFASSVVGEALVPAVDANIKNNIANFTAAGLVAGLTSRLVGGDFKQAFWNAFIVRALNHGMHSIKSMVKTRQEGDHWYYVNMPVCDVGLTCQLEYASSTMAPYTVPFETFGQYNGSGVYNLNGPGNFIYHLAEHDSLIYVNQTIEGKHLFDPGYVASHFYERGGKIWVEAVGYGTGRMPGFNERFGSGLFEGRFVQGRAYYYRLRERVQHDPLSFL